MSERPQTENPAAMDLSRLKIDRGPSRQRSEGGGPRAPRTRRRGGVLAWIFVLALAALAVWIFRQPLMRRVDLLRLPRVQVVPAVEQDALAASAVSGTAANGYVVAARRAALSADTPGRIVEMRVTEGSVVRAGEIVARLYADEYQADLDRALAELLALEASLARARAQAESSARDLERLEQAARERSAFVDDARARLDLAHASLARIDDLVADGFESEQRQDEAQAEVERALASHAATEAAQATAGSAVESARANVRVAEAAVREEESRREVLEAARDRAAATLEKTEVRAPFDGIVVLKDAEVGEVVSPNSQGGSNARGSVVTMVDFDSLEVQVDVPETSLELVRVGAPANVYLDARPSEPYPGRVDRIWPTADRQKATIEVRVTFLERDELLRPEMGARVVFDPGQAEPATSDAGAEPLVLIPTAAVVRLDGQPGAFVLERDRVRFRPLELGAERSGRQIVRAGLAAGERVVVDPPASLADGDRVQPETQT